MNSEIVFYKNDAVWENYNHNYKKAVAFFALPNKRININYMQISDCVGFVHEDEHRRALVVFYYDDVTKNMIADLKFFLFLNIGVFTLFSFMINQIWGGGSADFSTFSTDML